MMFVSRQPTGKIGHEEVRVDNGQTRILWLDGLGEGDSITFGRCVYIGGTLAELERMAPSALGKRYREALLQGTTGGDHPPMGLLDLFRHARGSIAHSMVPRSQGQVLAVVSVPL